MPAEESAYAQQAQQFVQPHINPRFASMWGFNFGYMQQQQQQQYPQYGQYGAGEGYWDAGGDPGWSGGMYPDGSHNQYGQNPHGGGG